MKWIRHNINSHDNLKIKQILRRFKLEGYGLFWLCIEILLTDGEEFTISANKEWKVTLCEVSKIPLKKLDNMLQFFAEIRAINKDAYEKGDLFMPQIIEYVDDYTKRIRRVSEQSSDNSPLRNDTIRYETIRYVSRSFDAFWIEYPNKIAKKKAFQSWSKINPDETLFKKIMESLREHKQSNQWTKDGGQFIPHPTTWLNQERWNDEIVNQTGEDPIIPSYAKAWAKK